MSSPASGERRNAAEKGPAARTCPWCRGRLVLEPRFPLRKMIPGEVREAAHANVPEALLTIPAWVCATPHCRYRETAI